MNTTTTARPLPTYGDLGLGDADTAAIVATLDGVGVTYGVWVTPTSYVVGITTVGGPRSAQPKATDRVLAEYPFPTEADVAPAWMAAVTDAAARVAADMAADA